MTAVVVTGTGAVSCVGEGVEALWAGMTAARSAPVRVSDPFARMPHPLMYEVDDARLAPPTGRGRTTDLLVRAAREAWSAAGTPGDVVPGRRIGVVVGTGMGDSGMHELSRAGEGVEGSALGPVYSVAGNLADELGARGPVVSISNACAAGAYAVAEAVQLLETGECDVVLACGAESYSRVALGAFNRMGAIDPTSCRPFSADRRGTVFGEGAAVLVLERADGARARGVTALASVIGYGLTCDADHPTAPDPEGAQAQRAMEQALRRAGLTASDVHAVVPHGTGTGHNDLAESAVLQRVLGRADLGPPVYSLKALLGHTGGAAGALAAVAAVEISRRRTVPGNVDVGVLDEACPVNLPVGSPVGTGGGHVLVNAYAFGGNNASILLGDAA